MIYETISILLPAIPLAIVAFNFRYTSLAGLMRNLSEKIERASDTPERHHLLLGELDILTKRMHVVKSALFCAALSFALCLFSMLSIIFEQAQMGFTFLITGLATLSLSCVFFCAETVLSTKALNLHLSKTMTIR